MASEGRYCGIPGCVNWVPATGPQKCMEHRRTHNRERDRARGTMEERGYGSRHRRMRAYFDRIVQSGRAYCCRCGGPIVPGSEWHLDHDDHDRSQYKGPSHPFAMPAPVVGQPTGTPLASGTGCRCPSRAGTGSPR